MKIFSGYNFSTYKSPAQKQSFGSAKKINLKYVYDNRLELLPERIKLAVTDIVENNKDIYVSLRDLHLKTYAPLRKCQNLDRAKIMFPEFNAVEQADDVVKRKTHNIRTIMDQLSLEHFSMYILKERWGKLKTLDEIAQSLGIKDRSALSWFISKIHMPEMNKNYLLLINASDARLNKKIADKTRTYNKAHRSYILERNRQLSAQNKELNRQISQEAWDRLPHIRQALSEISAYTPAEERFAAFWEKYPEYAQEYGEMKRKIAKEIGNKKNNL